jgi:hypothetical protein
MLDLYVRYIFMQYFVKLLVAHSKREYIAARGNAAG